MRRMIPALLLILTACGGTPSAQPMPAAVAPTMSEADALATINADLLDDPTPTSEMSPTLEPTAEPSPTASIAANLNGIWQADEPPLTLTIDLDAGQITSEINGLTETNSYSVASEEGNTIVLTSDKGIELTVRFISDDVVEWSTGGQSMTLTRQN